VIDLRIMKLSNMSSLLKYVSRQGHIAQKLIVYSKESPYSRMAISFPELAISFFTV
jgi:hypothetical protein